MTDTHAPTGGLVVLAKAPRPGYVKTRLSPPLTAEDAALVARAALADTLDTVLAASVPRRVLALDGPVGAWVPDGLDLVPQRGDGLDERLAHAFADVGGPALLIGMDTPQVVPPLLTMAWERLLAPDVDAVIGLALDGGWWALGLREPRDVFRGIATSTSTTGRVQLARLRALGMRTVVLPMLRDLDDIDDLAAIRLAAPTGRVARVAAAVLDGTEVPA